SFKNKCKQRMDSFWNGETTVLVVSHDLEFVKHSCDKVVWLGKGTIKFTGRSAQAVEQYLTPV
ncbi:MAG: ABC transporter ATP-binding protein, partial [Sphaerospermopsis kisseleviana]